MIERVENNMYKFDNCLYSGVDIQKFYRDVIDDIIFYLRLPTNTQQTKSNSFVKKRELFCNKTYTLIVGAYQKNTSLFNSGILYDEFIKQEYSKELAEEICHMFDYCVLNQEQFTQNIYNSKLFRYV